MASENVILLVVGGVALFVNAFLGGSIAAGIAALFGRRSTHKEEREPASGVPIAPDNTVTHEIARSPLEDDHSLRQLGHPETNGKHSLGIAAHWDDPAGLPHVFVRRGADKSNW